MTKDHLSVLASRCLIPEASVGRAPGREDVSDAPPLEVMVFKEQLECGLRLPCIEFLESVVHHFNLEVQHISPNSFVRLSTFEWALCSASYLVASAQVFAHLPTAGVLTKKADFSEGSLEVRYGNAFFYPREGAVVPAKAYCERRTTGWIKRWFYLSMGEKSSLKSSRAEPPPIVAPAVQLDDGVKFRIVAVASASRRFSMRDLVVEFVAAGMWPLARGWSFPVTPPLVTRELVTTEADDTTNFQREGFVWSFPGEFPSWEVHPLQRVAPDSLWWILTDLTVEEVEQRATVLLGPCREEEHLARVATGVTARENRILASGAWPFRSAQSPSPSPKGATGERQDGWGRNWHRLVIRPRRMWG